MRHGTIILSATITLGGTVAQSGQLTGNRLSEQPDASAYRNVWRQLEGNRQLDSIIANLNGQTTAPTSNDRQKRTPLNTLSDQGIADLEDKLSDERQDKAFLLWLLLKENNCAKAVEPETDAQADAKSGQVPEIATLPCLDDLYLLARDYSIRFPNGASKAQAIDFVLAWGPDRRGIGWPE
jgi:hypothetical protein